MNRLAILLSCVVLAGCGGNRGNQTTPLTADQKIKFAGTLESVGRAQKAGEEAQREATPHATPSDESLKKMADKIAAAKCDYALPQAASQPGSDPLNQTTEQGLKISGETCPIALDFSYRMTNKMSESSFTNSFDFVLKYDVKDAELAGMNDVSGIDLKGSGSIESGSTSISGKVDVEGSLKSKENGTLEMYVVGKIDGSGNETSASVTSELVWGVKYADFTAELKQVTEATHQEGQGSTKYFLNGQVISEMEFKSLLQKAGAVGAIKLNGSRQ
jgi:hypothetical protein